jgi:hypothetical protein
MNKHLKTTIIPTVTNNIDKKLTFLQQSSIAGKSSLTVHALVFKPLK